MKFNIQKQEYPLPSNITDADVRLVQKFAKNLNNTALVKSVFIDRTKLGDKKFLPVVVLIDDVSHHLTKNDIERYLKKVRTAINKTSEKLHVETLKFSKFWELAKNKEPNFIEMLRETVVAEDQGFIQPMKMLLAQGRIRPSREATWTYYIRTKSTLKNSRAHLMQASLDLYWACIDAGHAVLMKLGELPPKPSQVATLLEEKLVKTKKLEKKYPEIMRKFYKLSRGILHKQITSIKGEEFDAYLKDANDFIRRMKSFLTL